MVVSFCRLASCGIESSLRSRVDQLIRAIPSGLYGMDVLVRRVCNISDTDLVSPLLISYVNKS
jgi:hypothetical protein